LFGSTCCIGSGEVGQPKYFSDVSLRMPLRCLAKPEEYAGIVVYVLSDVASYLNGVIIPIERAE